MALTLKEKFGYQTFRPLQEEIIQHVLAGKDSLVIMPTGGGKSLCYQIPALLFDGLTLVVSPLIALMRDQVLALQSNGIAAAAVNSSIPTEDLRQIHQALEEAKLDLLYVSPEKLLSPRFLRYISEKNLSLIAIDEAHCVSIWGNDFRPEYAELKKVIKLFPHTPAIALTATADKATQVDIIKQLELRDARKFLSSFERKNIHIDVRSGQDRLKQILDFLGERMDEPGILYCLSRRSTEEMAAKLRQRNIRAAHYHAMMDPAERRDVQDAFQRDELQIVCATIAFGMGIDKSNIRWIIHYNMPKNIESYYQEIGRSGRDGLPATALMFYSFRDVKIYRQFIEESNADYQFKEVQQKKLNRIWELAQANSCRVNLVLNYFGEYRNTPCGHCDNCLQPPEGFNGQEIAELAIRACKEGKEKMSITLMVDVIRGSQRQEIRARRLTQVAVFGKGAEHSREDWLDYLTQLVNLGFLEIDYTDQANLKCTPLSELVINKIEKVKLYKRQEITFGRRPGKSKTEQFEDELFETLKEARRLIGRLYQMPPYLIFSDEVLHQICIDKPMTQQELLSIPGIGEFKAAEYGSEIIKVLRDYILHQGHLSNLKGKTQIQTLKFLEEGMEPEEVARIRKLKTETIFSHMATLYLQGEKINIEKYISTNTIEKVKAAYIAAGRPEAFRPVYERLSEPIEFGKLKLAIAFIRRQEKKMK